MAPSTDSRWRSPTTDSRWPPPTPEPAFHTSAPEVSQTTSSWRPPSSPREMASSVVASVQYVTSSVRLLLTGCFQCQSLKGGCWRRQEEPDGAWFDCDKLQVEHPYCYVNPVALTEATTPESSPNGTVLSHQPKPTLKVPAPLPKSIAKCPSKTIVDVQITPPEEPVPNGVINDGVEAVKGDTVIYKNGRVRTGLVESFAAKLEADLRRIECDRQRSGTEFPDINDVKFSSDEDVMISFPDYLCPDVDFFKDGDTDGSYSNEEGIKPDRRMENDVWKPSELEDVFECYNMAAFYSYGASMQLGEKSGNKNKGEKFEEVFPSTFNNNNTIKVYRPAGESESPLPLKDVATKENGIAIETLERAQEISEDRLKQFIHSCILAETEEQVGHKFISASGASTAFCDDYICYGSKSFNKLLIFNLVKSVMAECQEHYSHSMPLCANYPVQLVQNKILSVLQDDKDLHKLSTSGLHAFRNNALLNGPDSQLYQKQLVADKLVERAVIDELKKEMKDWQDVSQEEKELKEAISTEIVHDLISDTASLFDEIIRKKLKCKVTDETDQ